MVTELSVSTLPNRLVEVAVAVTVGALLVVSVSHGQALGSAWSNSANLPSPVSLESCVTNPDFAYAYCIGGQTSNIFSTFTNQVAYGNISLAGRVTGWSTTTSYPASVGGLSCVQYVLSIICVGGFQGHTPSGAVYSAPILSGGVGAWTAAGTYPVGVELQSCVSNSGFIYCIGGFDGIRDNGTAYYAAMTKSGGVGSWNRTTSYPNKVSQLSCVTDLGYAYCVGGATGGAATSDVYYALLSATGGVGTWVKTTSYPTTIYAHSCAVSYDYVYCVGGYTGTSYTNATYYAPLSSSGVGTWVGASAYTGSVSQQSCLSFAGVLHCFGGFYNSATTNRAFYAPVSQPQPLTVTATATSTSTVTTTVTVAPTATVTSVSTLPATTQTLTSTTTLYFKSLSLSSVTSTFQSFSVSTTTLTSTATSTASVTLAGQQAQQAPSAGAACLPAGSAAAGLVAGVVLTFLLTRLLGRRTPGEGRDEPARKPQSDTR
jgi:hypothetical protein